MLGYLGVVTTAAASLWTSFKYIKFAINSKQREIVKFSRRVTANYQQFLQFLRNNSVVFHLQYKSVLENSLAFHFKILDELIDCIKVSFAANDRKWNKTSLSRRKKENIIGIS